MSRVMIVWHGHSCFELRDGITVVIDPHDGKSIGIRPPHLKGDVVLVTHDHFDHNCVRQVCGCPEVITTSGEHTRLGLDVVGIPSFHDERRGEARGRNVIYRFEMEGMTFCHLGDLGHDLDEGTVSSLKGVDVLFIPVGGVFTIDAAGAHRAIDAIRPRVAIPMHYKFGGLSVAVRTIDDFLDGVPEGSILRLGDEVELFPDELPEETEYWVFTP